MTAAGHGLITSSVSQEFTSNPCWITRGEDCGSRPRNHLQPDGVKNQPARLQGQVRIQSVKVLGHPGGPGSNPESCLSDWELLCWSWSSEDRRVCKTTQIIRSSGKIILIHVKSDQSRVRPQLATRDAQTHSGDVSLSVSGDGAAQVSGVMATPKVVRL